MEREIRIGEYFFRQQTFNELIQLPQEKLAFLLELGKKVLDNQRMDHYILHSDSGSGAGAGPVPTAIPRPSPMPMLRLNTEENAAKIGASGEEYISSVLEADSGTGAKYKVENVARVGHQGDLLLSRSGSEKKMDTTKLMIEVKNYTQSVPGAEVDKFTKDLRTQGNISGGLFVSLRSKISGFEKDFVFQNLYVDRSIPVIFLSRTTDPVIIRLAVDLLWAHLDMKALNMEELEAGREQMNKIYTKIARLSDLLGGLSASRQMLEDTRENINKAFGKITNNIFTVEMQISQTVQKIQAMINRYSNLVETSESETSKKEITGKFHEIYQANIRDRIKEEYSDSFLHTHQTLQVKLFSILSGFLYHKTGENNAIVSVKFFDKKILISRQNKSVISIVPLKTKTNISIFIAYSEVNGENDSIEIPTFLTYEGGWISFSMDKTFPQSPLLPKIERYFSGQKK
jgi:CII-binding regulator of phage lambda lysogenization HflD